MSEPTKRLLPSEALFVVSGVSQYAGAVLAVRAFSYLAPSGVAWWRVLGGGVLLVLLRRSWTRKWTLSELRLAAAFGVVLGLMNIVFYMAIDRLPLGNAVAIEFLGPVVVAALTARSKRNWTGLVVAAAGVVVLANLELSGDRVGVFLALGAGALWALYIVLGERVANKGAAIDGLGVGMLFGAVALLPLVGRPALAGFGVPIAIALALGAGVLSNMIPYSLDQVILQRIPRGRYAVLLALLPVVATLVGFIALRQRPTAIELLGIGLVVLGIGLSDRPEEA